jgi:acetylornithine/succinyldiaminopimelate/putrescine aminotransferase
MLCCEWDNVRPDIILLGKALSGGSECFVANVIVTMPQL